MFSDVILSMSFKSFLFDSANSFLFELDATATAVSYRFRSFLCLFCKCKCSSFSFKISFSKFVFDVLRASLSSSCCL
jgi:hypothetical protein